MTDNISPPSRSAATDSGRSSREEYAEELTQFLELPAEVREKIYEHAIHVDFRFKITFAPRIEDTSEPYTMSKPRLPDICLTSKLEQSVSQLVAVRNYTILFSHDGHASLMVKWLESIAHSKVSYLSAVKNIEICYARDSPSNGFIEEPDFSRRFPKLHSIAITTPFFELYKMLMDLGPGTSACDEVMTNFNFDMLFECTSLKHVIFKLPGLAYGIVSSEMEEVADYLESTSMVKYGKELEVEVIRA